MISAAVLWAMQELSFLLGILCVALYPSGIVIPQWITLPAALGFGLSGKYPALICTGLLGCFLPGMTVPVRIIAVLVWLKCVYDMRKKRYVPDPAAVRSELKLLLQVYIVLFIIVLFMKEPGETGSRMLSFGLISGASGILLMRTLRHDPDVMDEPGFQVMNLLSVAGVFAAAYAGTREPVLHAVRSLGGFVYMRLFLPALTVMLYVVLYPLMWLGRLLDRLHFSFGSDMEEAVEIIMEEGPGLHFEDYEVTVRDRVSLFLPLMILLVLIVVFLLYRSRRSRRIVYQGTAAVTERTDRPERREALYGSDVLRVRRIYRRYLKQLKKRGIGVDPGDTSDALMRKSPEAWPADRLAEMREIYLRARYRGVADARDVTRMKELYAEIRR